MIDAKTLAELEGACQRKIAMQDAYREAVKAQAELHQLEPVALGQYVNARVRDTLAKLEKQQDTLHQLSLFGQRQDEAA